MSKEIKIIIDNLESCVGMFDYLLTPEDNNLLVSYIKVLQQENQQLKEIIIRKKSSIKALKIALKERTDERDNHYDKEHLYKSLLDEIRGYIEKETFYNNYNEVYRGILDSRNVNHLLQILDKVKDL